LQTGVLPLEDLLKQISDRVWVIQAATNTGIIKLNDEECLLIDPGGDKDNAKYALKTLERLGLKPVGVLVTHAHADHYGACAHLQKNVVGLEFFASPFESSLMEQPLLEPIFLYGGAEPIKELTHKFILAKPVAISARLAAGNWEYRGNNFQIINLPGHSTGQIGLIMDDLLFSGDALMLSDYIRKFKFPFYSNIATAFQSLNSIINSDYSLVIPGHGPVLEPDAYRREAEFAVANLKEMIEIAYSQLKARPLTMEGLLQQMAQRLEIQLATPIQYVLDRTLALAIVNYLAANNRAEHYFEDNLWYWKAV
jgi:glyoxylase-like metal-dependent hydrolase (beta-lactamase superfamily II)